MTYLSYLFFLIFNKSPSMSVIQTRSSRVGQVNQQTVKQNIIIFIIS